MKTLLRRTLHPEVKVLDETKGLVEYVASDESIDADKEVIRAKGWRFDGFRKNAPFINSHRGGSIDDQLGKVVDFTVKNGRLVETVQWAIDAGLPDTHLAMIGFKMTAAGYLKAVSVGFHPVKQATQYGDRLVYEAQLAELKLDTAPDEAKPWRIFIEQQQIELSSVIIGANPNALARAYKAGIVTDAGLETISEDYLRHSSPSPDQDAQGELRQRAHRRTRFIEKLHHTINNT